MGNEKNPPVNLVCVGITPEFVQQLAAICGNRFDIKSCDAESALKVAVQIVLDHPRIVLISQNLLCDKGVSFILEISNLDHQAAIAVLGTEMNAASIAECIPLGFAGLIDPDSPGEEIARALEAICAGEVWIPRDHLVKAVKLLTTGTKQSRTGVWNKLPSLTDREHEVFTGVMEGLSNREIAESLGISCETVKVHLKHVFSKLGVHRRTELLSQRL